MQPSLAVGFAHHWRGHAPIGISMVSRETRVNPRTTIIDLLRHGEVEGGACFRGSTDDPLTPFGWQQMEKAVNGGSWDCIISSPLRRCRDFAQALAERVGISLHLDGRLREVCFGRWEGMTAAALMGICPEALAKFWQAPFAHPPPGAEPLHGFEQRVLNAWREITCIHCGRRVLIITHGGVIRAILRQVRDLPREELLAIEVGHASLQQVVLPSPLRSEAGVTQRQ